MSLQSQSLSMVKAIRLEDCFVDAGDAEAKVHEVATREMLSEGH